MKGWSRGERGSVIVWVVLWLAVLIAFLALVINVGHSMTARGELQNGVDAAALAGALELRGTPEPLPQAGASATGYAAAHPTDRYQIAADAGMPWYGAWTPRARPCDSHDVEPDASSQPQLFTSQSKFCRVLGTDADAAFRINAVHVQAQRAGTPGGTGGGALNVVLNAFLSSGPTMTRSASAIAVTGGPSSVRDACIPMVVGVGCLTGSSGGSACDPGAPAESPGPQYVLGLSSTQVRSAGWSVFSDVNPSDTAVCDFLQAGCASLSIGDMVQIDIGQGNKFNGGCHAGSGAKKVCDWFKPLVGTTVSTPTISDSGNLNEACPDTYTGDAWVVGFATMRILAVNCSESSKKPDCVQAPGTSYCTDAAAPCSQFASDKCVLAQLVCNHDPGTRSTGGAWTGTSPLKPILVK